MIIPDTEIEPMLVDFVSDESVVGDTSDSGIDALWWEVGELLEDHVIDFDEKPQQEQQQAVRGTIATTTEKKRARNLDTVATKRRKSFDEDDVKREVRMARNRASAERTRLRRLEHVKTLETKAVELENHNEKLFSILKEQYRTTEEELDQLASDFQVEIPLTEPPRRSRSKKADAKEVIKKLEKEAEGLSADEVARLRKEARMARNRASAERTRLRRLEAARQLEIRVNLAQLKNERYSSLLEELSKGSHPDMQETGCEGVHAKPCSEHEVVRHELLCKTRPVSGDLQSVCS